MNAEVINVLPTGHRLQARPFIHFGQHGAEIITDAIAGDGFHHLALTASEMDALCKWWLAKSGAVIVPKDIANAAAGTVALLGDERICKFGRPSPEARLALRNLATALGWKEADTVDRP